MLFTAMGVIWGIPYLLIKVAVEGLSVPVLVFARTAVGALVLIPLTLRRGAWAPVLAHWRPVVAFAFFEIIAAWLLLSDAERHITSSLTGLLIAAAPIVAALLDRLTGGDQPLTVKRLAGLGTGLAGVAVLAGPELAGGSAWPVTEVLLVAVCYAIAPLIAARYLAEVPAMPLTAACLGLAALIYVGPAAATWPAEIPSMRVLTAVALLAVVCTSLAFILFFALIREVGAPRALVITYVNPAVALAAGVIVLNEPLTARHLLGLAMILAGSVLATRRPVEPMQAAPR
ncbi:EamA/RhaT family transporter [Mycolicibacterium austroafricanum]|nr:EamA/RhaT family transporter [Mycolicibacterium austroafricanum]